MSEDSVSVRPAGGIVLYQLQESGGDIRVLLEGETVWLTQNLMAVLYQTTKQNINLHIQNIYEEGSRTVRRPIGHYNLDMIIAVGYRVKSPIATRFRQWATARLREYLVKGFTPDHERLKGGDGPVDYFDELLARIREIRASKARVYQEGEEETQGFFATARTKCTTPLQAWRRLRRSCDVAPTRASPTWAQRRGKAAAFSSAISARPRTISTIRKSTPSTASPSCSPTRPSSAPSGGGWRRKPRPRPSTSRTCGRLRRCWRRGVRNRKRRRRGRESQDGSNAGRAANERLGSHRHRLRLYRRARPGPKLASPAIQAEAMAMASEAFICRPPCVASVLTFPSPSSPLPVSYAASPASSQTSAGPRRTGSRPRLPPPAAAAGRGTRPGRGT